MCFFPSAAYIISVCVFFRLLLFLHRWNWEIETDRNDGPPHDQRQKRKKSVRNYGNNKRSKWNKTPRPFQRSFWFLSLSVCRYPTHAIQHTPWSSLFFNFSSAFLCCVVQLLLAVISTDVVAFFLFAFFFFNSLYRVSISLSLFFVCPFRINDQIFTS